MRRRSPLQELIFTALQKTRSRHTDGNGSLDEETQRKVIGRWIRRFHQSVFVDAAGSILLGWVRLQQAAICSDTRPSAKAILDALGQAGMSIVGTQPPLLPGFADERYYVGPGLSKCGRDMTMREALVALKFYRDGIDEGTAKYNRIMAIVNYARSQGLQLDDSLRKLFP